jgi:hypothetical protein
MADPHDKILKEILEKLNQQVERKDETLGLRRVQETLDKAAVLNGGFDRVMIKLDHITQKQEETSQKVNKIHDALYEPDSGFFARVANMEHKTESIDQQLVEHEIVDKNIEEGVKKVAYHEEVTSKLKKIAGDDLQELNKIIKVRKAFDKMFWLVTAGFATMVAKIVWEMYQHSHLVSAVSTAVH